MAKLTFDDLLARAAAREADAAATLDITLPDGESELTFQKLPDAKIMELLTDVSKAPRDRMIEAAYAMADHLIYFACPALQATKLHAQLEVAEPWDVVAKLFSLSERDELSMKLMQWMEIDKLANDTKNA